MSVESTQAEGSSHEKPPFNKDIIIQDVVRFYPEVVEILLEYGLHCIGCHVSGFETIEEGALGHGMSEDEVQNMIDDAKDRIEEVKAKKSSEVSS